MKTALFIYSLGISVFGIGFGSAGAAEVSTAELKAAIIEANVTLPKMVDEETRLDRIEAGANEAVYFYTMVNWNYDQLDWDVVADFVFQNSATNYCTGADMVGFREANIDMLYIYYDKNGEMVGTVKVPHTVCGN
ncbi:MAG: hypothetical protein ACTSU8_00420 [Alphaproteobacteria bacterium]